MNLVSIVITTYNSSKTLLETLDSIRKQSYQRLELIISDDYSTDKTVLVAKMWLRKNRRRFENIKILTARRNHGVTKNCNIGVSQARGKYVQLVGDEILMPNAIEKKVAFAETHHVQCVFSKIEPVGHNKKKVDSIRKICDREYQIIQAGWEMQKDVIVEKNFVVGTTGGFYLLDYFRKVGGYDIRFPMLEDYPFVWKYILAGNEMVLLDEVLLQYLIRDDSLSMSKIKNKKYLKSIKKFFFVCRLPVLVRLKKYEIAWFQLKYFMRG